MPSAIPLSRSVEMERRRVARSNHLWAATRHWRRERNTSATQRGRWDAAGKALAACLEQRDEEVERAVRRECPPFVANLFCSVKGPGTQRSSNEDSRDLMYWGTACGVKPQVSLFPHPLRRGHTITPTGARVTKAWRGMKTPTRHNTAYVR
ncbi:hypothetical protein NDU88_002103 [Pleurodeles waltl]|uniref:Uncharacterized protein n=1 Tax=Pleurodeles waltl TaxID=8319 RepID=A0AAV7WQN8_PLEWA|nr:hypothetical protein NDU88_002103 [Pleurodeles waltl]